MARKLSVAFLAIIFIAALVHSSAAQRTHTVGDAKGWIIPSNDATLYSSWAANQTFAVGDTLVFNFAANQHDVTTVNKSNYDACNNSNSISRVTTSPARIAITSTGEHYFICGFSGHCSAGQKLMINVSAATSAPAPQPTTSSPAPQPSSVPAPPPATPSPISAPSPTPDSTPPASPTPVSTPPPSPTTVSPPPPGTSNSPPSSPSPSGSTTPPTDSSARRLGAVGLSAAILSIFVAFLF